MVYEHWQPSSPPSPPTSPEGGTLSPASEAAVVFLAKWFASESREKIARIRHAAARVARRRQERAQVSDSDPTPLHEASIPTLGQIVGVDALLPGHSA